MAEKKAQEPLEGELIQPSTRKSHTNESHQRNYARPKGVSQFSTRMSIIALILSIVPYIGLLAAAFAIVISRANNTHKAIAMVAGVIALIVTGFWSVIFLILDVLF